MASLSPSTSANTVKTVATNLRTFDLLDRLLESLHLLKAPETGYNNLKMKTRYGMATLAIYSNQYGIITDVELFLKGATDDPIQFRQMPDGQITILGDLPKGIRFINHLLEEIVHHLAIWVEKAYPQQ